MLKESFKFNFQDPVYLTVMKMVEKFVDLLNVANCPLFLSLKISSPIYLSSEKLKTKMENLLQYPQKQPIITS